MIIGYAELKVRGQLMVIVKKILCKMVIGKYATPKSCFDTNSFFIVSVFVFLDTNYHEFATNFS